MAYQMAWIPMTVSELEGHVYCVEIWWHLVQ